jgi:hypothetical protein
MCISPTTANRFCRRWTNHICLALVAAALVFASGQAVTADSPGQVTRAPDEKLEAPNDTFSTERPNGQSGFSS